MEWSASKTSKDELIEDEEMSAALHYYLVHVAIEMDPEYVLKNPDGLVTNKRIDTLVPEFLTGKSDLPHREP